MLVLIGGEILWYVYVSKGQDTKVKYDAFSIFLVMIIVFFSIGMYALTATGVVDEMTWRMKSSIMTVDVQPRGFPIDEGVERIVVYAPGGRLDIKKGVDSEIMVFGRAVVNAVDVEEAGALIEENPVTVQRSGNILFVQFPSDIRPGGPGPSIRELRYTLLLPTDRAVEISGDYFYIDVDADALGKAWLLKGNGTLNTVVTKDADLFLEAWVYNTGQLKGNVNWEIEELAISPEGRTTTYKGYLKWGEGINKADIFIDSGEITVKEL